MIMESYGTIILFLSVTLLVQGSTADQPNIVLLFADDLGWGDLAIYGHPTSSTPNLDKMASEGLIFKEFYSASPVCSPSRAALLTGRYQTRSGIYPGVLFPQSTKGLPLNETTIAKNLKSVGYNTAMVGKWHLGVGKNFEYLPTKHGFDSYFGIPYSHDMCPFHSCFYPDVPCFTKGQLEDVGCPIFSNDVIFQQPANFLNLTNAYISNAKAAITKAADQSSPFFLYVAFQHTHFPQFAGKQLTNTSVRGPFGDALAELDWGVGQIMDALKEANVEENTFVFFTSDNGPALAREVRGGNAGLLRCGKGTTWEGGQREPAIAWWPGKIKPGKTQELAATVDIFPTLMKLAGAELPNVTLDGFDMSPILFDGTASKRDFYMYYPTDPTQANGLFAVRWNQYKAHFHSHGGVSPTTFPDEVCRSNFSLKHYDPPLLYDLHHDPSEIYHLDTKLPQYAPILEKITKMKSDFDSAMIWGESQMEPRDQMAQPCAKPGCSPFPSCCKTDDLRPLRSDTTWGVL